MIRTSDFAAQRGRRAVKINLFELFEDLFEGTLYFFYNIVATAATVLRHPFEGPAQLVRARAAYKAVPKELSEARARAAQKEAAGPKPKPQVGGLTFLFVCMFAFLLMQTLLPGGAIPGHLLLTIFAQPGEIGIGPAWPIVIGALAAAALIDAVTRLLILLLDRLSVHGRSGRQDELVNRVEYALICPMLGFIALVGALVAAVPRGPGAALPGWWTGLLFAGLLANVVAGLPGVHQLWPYRKVKKPEEKQSDECSAS
jgi:hypothetical protein